MELLYFSLRVLEGDLIYVSMVHVSVLYPFLPAVITAIIEK
jgi:hypothetical protein